MADTAPIRRCIVCATQHRAKCDKNLFISSIVHFRIAGYLPLHRPAIIFIRRQIVIVAKRCICAVYNSAARLQSIVFDFVVRSVSERLNGSKWFLSESCYCPVLHLVRREFVYSKIRLLPDGLTQTLSNFFFTPGGCRFSATLANRKFLKTMSVRLCLEHLTGTVAKTKPRALL